MGETVAVCRGFQPLNSHRFSHNIKCATLQSAECVSLHYSVASENVVSLCPFKPFQQPARKGVPQHIVALIYTRRHRLYVASCSDLTLRVFNEHFELIDSVHLTATVLSLAFNEQSSELFTGGVGGVDAWTLRHQLHNPLVPARQLLSISQWVLGLHFDPQSSRLVAASQGAVYVIDTQSCRQTALFPNTHGSSITSAVLYTPLEFVVSAAKDGSIKVWNGLLLTNVHTFSGHLKAVTGLQTHPRAPCVLSSSLDGTVRMWHLETLIECCRFDCAEELLGLTSCDLGGAGDCRLAGYSAHTLHMWSINQLETPFCSVSSDVLCMSRVEDHCSSRLPARILAMAEDGGVRLLSPVSGRVITSLFPMLSSQMVVDVVYSGGEELLFALLQSSELLLLSAATNPATALQLWTCQPGSGLICITTCTVAMMADHAPVCVVFGGQQSGYISLLHGRGYSMPHPCPAHAGHVTMMVGSCDPITSPTSTALVSFGDGNMLNVWSIELDKDFNISLQLKTSTHLSLNPSHLCLSRDLLCVALSDSTIVMYPPSEDPPAPLCHQSEDDHQAPILSLSVCPALLLFASTSRDGSLKIWSSHNQLVTEMHFGQTLTAVCFGSTTGDLLVGFQGRVSLVRRDDYLPASLALPTVPLPADKEETPITFDPQLQFWYDSACIPTLPADQMERSCLECSQSAMVAASPVESTQPRECLLLNSRQPAEEPGLPAKLSSPPAELSVELSHLPLPQSCSDPPSPSDDATVPSDSPLPPVYSAQTSTSLEVWPVAKETNKLATVKPIAIPSSQFTIAPDGLIPNSIIRAEIGYSPPPVTLPANQPYRPPDVCLPSSSPSSSFCSLNEWVDDCSEGTTPTCMSRILWEELSSEGNEIDDDDSFGASVHDCDEDTHTVSGGDSVAGVWSVGAQATSQLLSASRQHTTPLSELTPPPRPHHAPPPSFPPVPSPRHQSRQDHRPKEKKPHITVTQGGTPSFPRNDDVITIESECSRPMLTQQEHSTTVVTATPVEPSLRVPPPGPPYHRSQPGSTNPPTGTAGAGVHISQLPCEDTADLLEQICHHHWFPRQQHDHSLSAIFECLMNFLSTAEQPVFSEACTAVLDMKRACVLSGARLRAAAQRLVGRLQRGSAGVKTAALLTLPSLPHDTPTVLALLPLLIDTNLSVRSAAFSSLKLLAGITTRSRLHQLLIEARLLQCVEINEDEVLAQLAVRMEKEPGPRHSGASSSPDFYQEEHPQSSEQQTHRLPPLSVQKGRDHSLTPGKKALMPLKPDLPSHRHKISVQRRRHLKAYPQGSFQQQQQQQQQQAGPTFKPGCSTAHHTTQSNKSLCQLLATQPTSFSQSRPAIRLMMDAYSHRPPQGRAKRGVEYYAWSNVLPFGERRSSRASLAAAGLAPETVLILPSLMGQEAAGEGRSRPTSRPGRERGVSVVVKLPRISGSKLSLT